MYDQETIKTVLPHRDPFLFCDRILECTPERTVAEVDYGPDRYFFKGHFPGHPVCPGVILVESMAQCGGAGYRLATPNDEKKLFLFAKLMEVRFVNQVLPGDTQGHRPPPRAERPRHPRRQDRQERPPPHRRRGPVVLPRRPGIRRHRTLTRS